MVNRIKAKIATLLVAVVLGTGCLNYAASPNTVDGSTALIQLGAMAQLAADSRMATFANLSVLVAFALDPSADYIRTEVDDCGDKVYLYYRSLVCQPISTTCSNSTDFLGGGFVLEGICSLQRYSNGDKATYPFGQ